MTPLSSCRRPVRLAVSAVAVASLALTAGCGVGTQPGTNVGQHTMVSDLGTNPPNFNRYLTTEIGTKVVGETIYEPLIAMNSKFQLLPRLATKWDVSSDGLTYTFHLRKNVEWSDGKPFTSADVKYTFDTYLPLSPHASTYASLIKGIDTPDPNTVIINLKDKFSPLLRALTENWILPKHVFDNGQKPATNSANLHPIGTGPFELDKFVQGSEAVVVRNPHYWGKRGNADKIVFKVVQDPTSRLLAMQSGQISYLDSSYVDVSNLKRFDNDPKYALMPEFNGVSVTTLQMNTKSPELRNAEVRQAVYQAISKGQIAKNAYFGYATPASAPIPQQMSWATDPSVNYLKQYPYDPSAASKKLTQAGLPSGDRGTLRLAYPSNYPQMETTANIIKANLEQLGFKVNLIGEDFNVWTDRVYTKHDYDLSVIFLTTLEDPSLGVAREYVCNPEDIVYDNPSQLCDNQITSDFDQARKYTDDAARQKYFVEAEKRIGQLAYNMPLVDQVATALGRKDAWNLPKVTSSQPPMWSALSSSK